MAHLDTENYRFRFPGLPLRAVKFFGISNLKKEGSIRARSVQEFIQTYQADDPGGRNLPQPGAVDAICQRLCGAGYLTFMGSGAGPNLSGLAHCYLAAGVDERVAATLESTGILTRRLDCAVYGFRCVYDVYKLSILPIAHTTQSDRQSIGTGFVVGATTFLTAAHCIDGAKQLAIRGVPAAELDKARFSRAIQRIKRPTPLTTRSIGTTTSAMAPPFQPDSRRNL